MTQGAGNFLGTCPLVALGDEKNPDKLRDKNLTGLLMELVNNIWVVLHENTSSAQCGKNRGSRLYTTGNPSQLRYIHEVLERTNRLLSLDMTRSIARGTDRPTDTHVQQFIYCCVYSLPRDRDY